MKCLENNRIAVMAKGRITQETMQWFNANCNTSFPEEPEPFGPTRELTDTASGITLVGLSNGDVFRSLNFGLARYAVGGLDKFCELTLKPAWINDPNVPQSITKPLKLRRVASLGFGVCQMALLRPRDAEGQVDEVV